MSYENKKDIDIISGFRINLKEYRDIASEKEDLKQLFYENFKPSSNWL